MENIKKTLLNQWHKSQGANMAEFGGYDMPLWYLSAKNEHMTVITDAGLFDTSHMASIMVSGSGTFELLQLCFTNDMAACMGKDKKPLFPGRCVYGGILSENGHVIDDTIIFHIRENEYMAVVNAGMGADIAAHFHKNKENRDVNIIDLTDRLGKIDIQGPASAKIMKKILKNPEQVFDKMPYFSFKGHFDKDHPNSDIVRINDNTPILLSRTGYTGEFGFEIFMTSDHLVKVWEMLLEAGREFNVTACGLAARDSLRAGAVLPLSHQDIGHWPFINNPWDFSLPYNNDNTGFTKEFIGSKALLNIKNPEYTYAFAGMDLRKVTLPALVFDKNGKEIGKVLTCATDMAVGRHEGKIYSIASTDKPENLKIKGLSCGFIKVDKQLFPGDNVELKDSRRNITVQVEKDIRPGRTARKLMKEMV
ncbi:Glycine cleavage system, aminomethyltransferase protein T [Desulfonema limicola]|uniref:Glycine cleavage system, aminomethyltransferase protein T n=1 Tax=Desulfonema limicola TaxID=45656 RepID=A0A975B3T7_9BACT|nr:aminomethyl transferase family protein [Desulfonema limicola]QTA78277.1 Glycine cleavage system, aminomethyltransferase protein T [Desulfonema limicola]